MKMCCTRCGHQVYQTEKFCGNCSHQIEVVCLGKLDGNQCSQPINSEVRFCSNCGTTNPGFIIGKAYFNKYIITGTIWNIIIDLQTVYF